MTEVWRPIPGYEGAYEVSSLGRFRSLDRVIAVRRNGTTHSHRVRGRMLRPKRREEGYVDITLCHEGRGTTYLAHSLVLAAFRGPRPPGMECCHDNGVRDANHLDNLRYDTPGGNLADRKRHGTHPQGMVNPRAVLTEACVRKIRAQPQRSIASLGREFGVSPGAIWFARSGRTWGHVT